MLDFALRSIVLGFACLASGPLLFYNAALERHRYWPVDHEACLFLRYAPVVVLSAFPCGLVDRENLLNSTRSYLALVSSSAWLEPHLWTRLWVLVSTDVRKFYHGSI